MRKGRLLRGGKITLFALLSIGLLGLVVEHLWNWLLPSLFGLRAISFAQALGLLVLSKLLFGGFHRHGGSRAPWGRRMRERWESMTPEEKERLRAGFAARSARGCGPDWMRTMEPRENGHAG